MNLLIAALIFAVATQTRAFKSFNKKYQPVRIRDPKAFDLIANALRDPNVLYHVVISGDDGSSNHCICVYNNFIFDGNYTKAWRFSKKSLYQCLNSDYAGIECGYMYLSTK